MNTNPDAITVLCYGDSNTKGSRPDADGRYGPDKRWTGILQNGLGDGYYVIEEGLGGRTTNLEFPESEGRNGRQYIVPCIESHNPLDVVIIMLGTNDLKDEFNRSPSDIAQALEELIIIIKKHAINNQGRESRIIVVSPIHIADFIEDTEFKGRYLESSHEKSLKLAEYIKELADKLGVEFFDAASVAPPGDDALHMDNNGHKALGEALTKVVISG